MTKVFGSVELDLTRFEEGRYNYMKIPLKNCLDDSALIEVGIQGVEATETV